MPKFKESFFKKQNGHVNAAMMTWKYIRGNTELLNELKKFHTDENISCKGPAELIYMYCHSISESPLCDCGNTLPFRSISVGYAEYCSKKCQGKSQKVKNARRITVNDRFGVDHVFKAEQVKHAIKQTIMREYNVDNVSKSEKIKARKSETCLKNHGALHPMQSKSVCEKSKKTCIEKWGETSPWKNKAFKDQKYAEWIKMFGVYPAWNDTARTKRSDSVTKKYTDRLNASDLHVVRSTDDSITLICGKCKNEYTAKKYLLYQRIVRYGVNPCTICNPVESTKSFAENELAEELAKITGTNIERNVKINGVEVDIFIRNKKIAVEYDGLYWHSTMYRDKNYHINKTKKCAEVGIRLIHVFEDEWKYRKNIVLDIILGSLKISKQKIYARNCEIREISDKEYKAFAETNHLQGYAVSSIRIGLIHQKNIVSIMTFAKQRGIYKRSSTARKEYEMVRYATTLGKTVIGGAEKMFSYFKNNYDFEKVTSYCDIRYFTGAIYEKLGFKYAGDTVPNYWYVFGDTRSHRFNHRKAILVKRGFDPQKTERAIMADNGVLTIYDCGNRRYVYE